MSYLAKILLSNLTDSVVAIFTSNLILYAFYRAFKTKWPEQYFSLNNKIDSVLSVSPYRIILFRFLPPLTTITMVNAMLFSSPNSALLLLVGFLSAGTHSLLTNGRAIIQLVNGDKDIKRYLNKHSQILLHIISIALVIFSAYISTYLVGTQFIQSIKPSIEGLADNIWSSVIVGIFIVLILDLYREQNVDETYLINQSKERISKRTWSYLDKEATKQNANATLLKAICIVENIQRPKWVRFLERLKSYVWKKGTYGIMQFYSTKYLSDKESISLAVTAYFANTAEVKYEENLRELIKRYNNNPDYIDLVLAAMRNIDGNSIEYMALG